MNVTAIMETRMYANYFKNVGLNLLMEKQLVEKHFDWIKVRIVDGAIWGFGSLIVNGNRYEVSLEYKPRIDDFGRVDRFDRIRIKGIKHHSKTHLYLDDTLCLYHPRIDRSPFRILPLVTIIPWISEWCIHYEEWKKYGTWLGKEIEH